MKLRIDIFHHFESGDFLTDLLNKNHHKIMATLKELSDKVDELQATVDGEQNQIRDSIDVLTQTIQSLRDEIANGGNATAIQEIIDKLDATRSDLESTVPPPAT